MRNKQERKKCKGQESTIGKIIYGFLLFLPLFAIGVTCGYAMFNKNAYQSYYGETINEEQYIHPSSIELNKEYYIQYIYDEQNSAFGSVYFNIEDFEDKTNVFNINDEDVTRITFTNSGGTYPQISLYSGDTLLISKTTAGIPSTKTINLSFIIVNVNDTTNLQNFLLTKKLYYIEYNKNSFISEVFYYSIDRVQQSPLFNWAENSIIYTTTSSTCNALSITTAFIPLLMSYWLIISVIYFLYDIALMLVWIVHRKIHELQESI